MDLFNLHARIFRALLKGELPLWREEGIIDEEAEAGLARRYHLDEEGVSVAATAIYILGVLLIGGGIISFVAWNWDNIPKVAKLVMLGSALVAAHASGYWLWRVSGRHPRLGHALILLGTLIFGASIGLVAQIYHLSDPAGGGYGLWALGAAAAAWSFRSVPNALLALALTVIWMSIHIPVRESLHALFPFVVTIPFLPLARLERSRTLFAAVLIAFLYATGYAGGFETDTASSYVLAQAAATSLVIAFGLWARGVPNLAPYGHLAATLGMLAAVPLFYFFSFHDLGNEATFAKLSGKPLTWLLFALPAAGGAIAFAVLALRRGGKLLKERPATLAALAGLPLLVFSLIPRDAEVTMAVAANLVLAVIAITAVMSAVRTLERGPFWLGSILGGAVILTRFIEFQTELWLKAIVFVALGVAVIWFGLTFERQRQAGTGGADD